MPAYKDDKTGKWFAKFYYTDWQGNNKQKWKRGFATKKEALAFERDICSTLCSYSAFVDFLTVALDSKI